MKQPLKAESNRLFVLRLIAVLCFAAFAFTFAADRIREHNERVKEEQANAQMDANWGGHFIVDASPDIRPTYQLILLILSGLAFGFAWTRPLAFLSIGAFLGMIAIEYFWITNLTKILSDSPGYLSDVPYLLRVASIYDWISFSMSALGLAVYLLSLPKLVKVAFPPVK